MKNEAKANADADQAAKEEVEKVNQADSLIFQTDKQLKEFGDKLSDGNKTAIEGALNQLREAHGKKDIPAIDTAMEALNKAWEAASQEIYQAQQEAAGGAGAPGPDAGAAGGAQADGGSDADVADVEYEEVDDKK